MSWTKRQFIEIAFEQIGLASYVFDLQAEQLESALRTLDAMVASWNAKGVKIGYPLPSSPESSSLDTETGVPDACNEAIYLSLAIRLAPTMGKLVSRETKVAARSAMKNLYSLSAIPDEMQITGLPRGQGHKASGRRENRFLSPPTEKDESFPLN